VFFCIAIADKERFYFCIRPPQRTTAIFVYRIPHHCTYSMNKSERDARTGAHFINHLQFTLAFCLLAVSISLVVSMETRGKGLADAKDLDFARVSMEMTNEIETASSQNASVNCKYFMKKEIEKIRIALIDVRAFYHWEKSRKTKRAHPSYIGKTSHLKHTGQKYSANRNEKHQKIRFTHKLST
jgi:hypothetical protein